MQNTRDAENREGTEWGGASFPWTLHKVGEEAKFLGKDNLTEVTLVRVSIPVAPFMQHKGTVLGEYDIAADAAIEFAL